MNDVMDEKLNRSEIPADYAETMCALFRDKSQGDVIRDFADQHIGLYAETLNMRGKYDVGSRGSASRRRQLRKVVGGVMLCLRRGIFSDHWIIPSLRMSV